MPSTSLKSLNIILCHNKLQGLQGNCGFTSEFIRRNCSWLLIGKANRSASANSKTKKVARSVLFKTVYHQILILLDKKTNFSMAYIFSDSERRPIPMLANFTSSQYKKFMFEKISVK